MGNEVKRTKPLIEAWKKTNSFEIRRVIESKILKINRGMLLGVAKRYAVNQMDQGDLFNEISMTVRLALDTFDPTMNVQFNSWWAYNMHSSTYLWRQKWLKYQTEIVDSQLHGPDSYTEGQHGVIRFKPVYDKAYSESFLEILSKGKLDFKYKQMMSLYYEHRLSHRQIGAIFNVSYETIRNRIKECHESMKKVLGDEWKSHSLQY